MNKTKQKQSNRYKVQTDGCQRGGWWDDWAEKGKGIKKYKLLGIKYQQRDIVNTKYGDRWLLDALWWSLHKVLLYKYWITVVYLKLIENCMSSIIKNKTKSLKIVFLK